MSTQTGNKLLMTVEQFCDYAEIGRTTVYVLIKSGELETITIGRSRRIPVEAAHRWLEEKLSA